MLTSSLELKYWIKFDVPYHLNVEKTTVNVFVVLIEAYSTRDKKSINSLNKPYQIWGEFLNILDKNK